MVGRDSQLETLQSLYGVVQAGRSRVAFLVGEPGIGKSRLLAEFRRWVTDDARADADAEAGAPATWLEGRCVSYGRNLPYHLLQDLVRFTLKISFAESETEARAGLDRELLALLQEDAHDAAPFLAHLLALPLHPEETDRALLDPETMQGRYLASIHRVVRALSSRGPVVLICEDLHWADPASVSRRWESNRRPRRSGRASWEWHRTSPRGRPLNAVAPNAIRPGRIAEADHVRLVKEARIASRGTGVRARWPLIWLREATGSIAARLMTLTRVHAPGH